MKSTCLVFLLCLSSTSALACNIPVFRYALERWQPDSVEIVVFFDAPLSLEQERHVAEMEAASTVGGGPANAEIHRVKIGSIKDEHKAELWQIISSQKKVSLPLVVVRTKLGRDRIAICWQGPLDDFLRIGLMDSPIRQDLSKRLLSGESVVWLMLKSSDSNRNNAAKELMTKEFAKMSDELSLPDGIGLPGSELHAEIPLLLKFSVLELDPADAKELFLIKMLSNIHVEAYATGDPMLVPVFGRGRALEVIPASQLDADLIHNLTLFLCGACSCQVKEKNPGFDLLMSVEWNKQLFGSAGLAPPASNSLSEGKSQVPVQLTIPPGKKSR